MQQQLRKLCDRAGDALYVRCRKVLEELCEDEIRNYSTNSEGEQHLSRLLRTVLLAVGASTLECQFSAETIKPKIPGMKKIIKSRYPLMSTQIDTLKRLWQEIGGDVTARDAETAGRLIAKQLYKNTSCGISFIPDDNGVRVAGYCEGWDGECSPHRLQYPFTMNEFWEAVEAADKDGCDAWDDSHGCEQCWDEDNVPLDEAGAPREFGNWPVNKECPHCAGEGVAL